MPNPPWMVSGTLPALSARPRERATKAKRGAGSADAVPRSGTA